mmetsp:Transcript_109283/g.332336  ORF Transcript_109283/g.332336 Transcript_109283/m.332336 type:complete len:81 (-) Transcript_109283:50-292(-)
MLDLGLEAAAPLDRPRSPPAGSQRGSVGLADHSKFLFGGKPSLLPTIAGSSKGAASLAWRSNMDRLGMRLDSSSRAHSVF